MASVDRTRQTTTDTEKAKSRLATPRVTRSEEFQRRVDAASRVEQVGTPQGNVDFVASATTASSGGGSSGLSGIEIIWADQTETFIPASDFFVDYDPATPTFDLYWSIVFAVSDDVMTKVITYDEVQDIFEDDGGAPALQTNYRLRLITQNNSPENVAISVYGQYREVTTCINGAPFQRLTKVT
jgi:hypothetical protein